MIRKYLQNLHTHSTYCDGADRPEEMIERAFELGFDTIGFSGHSYMYFSPLIGMTPEATEAYKRELRELKAKYADRIRVLCGLEFEMLSQVPLTGYDYLIGSCHYLKIGDEIVGIDRKADEVKRVIDTYYGGDGLRCAQAYYEMFSHLHEYGDFDIVGHFDLITKNCEKADLFDVDSPGYRKAALDCLHELSKHFRLFEVNTGAIARGYRTTPYPAPFLLKEMKRIGCSVLISSDCHDRRKLDIGFDQAMQLIADCGFDEVIVYTDRGFEGVKIDL